MSNITFENNSGRIKESMVAAVKVGMEESLLIIESQAKALATVDTGELRDKIFHENKVSEDGVEGVVGSPLEYAPYIEFGTGEFAENGSGRKGGWYYTGADGVTYFTKGNRPKPFLRPAFRANKDNVERILGDALKDAFE